MQIYHLIKFRLLFQVLLHHSVVVVDTVAMEMVHLRCRTQQIRYESEGMM